MKAYSVVSGVLAASLLLTQANAYDIEGNIDYLIGEINNHTYNLADDEPNGLYYKFDSTGVGKWLFYSKKYNYLLVHETGREKVSEGAKQFVPTDVFSYVDFSNLCVNFGDALVSDPDINTLANQQYCLRPDTESGLYQFFDQTNNLWFLYMPKYDYLLIHETGKNTIAEGAWYTVNAISLFGAISLDQDAFGNYTNTITFGMNSSSYSSSSSEMSSSSYSSSTGLELPPSPPDITTSSSDSSTELQTPPSPPQL